MGRSDTQVTYPTLSQAFRSHVADSARFKMPVPLRSEEVESLVHASHRIGLLLDSVLPVANGARAYRPQN